MKKIKKLFFYIKNKITKERYTKKLLINSQNYVDIGDYTYGKPNVLYGGKNKLKIGKFCSISEEVVIFLGGNHRLDWVTTYPFKNLNKDNIWPKAQSIVGHPASKGDVIIGNDVWLGYQVIILSGVTIGDGAVIGANAVVTKNVAPYSIVAGNPAREIRKRFDDKIIEALLKIKWWNWSNEKINDNLNNLCNNDIEKFIKLYN